MKMTAKMDSNHDALEDFRKAVEDFIPEGGSILGKPLDGNSALGVMASDSRRIGCPAIADGPSKAASGLKQSGLSKETQCIGSSPQVYSSLAPVTLNGGAIGPNCTPEDVLGRVNVAYVCGRKVLFGSRVSYAGGVWFLYTWCVRLSQPRLFRRDLFPTPLPTPTYVNLIRAFR